MTTTGWRKNVGWWCLPVCIVLSLYYFSDLLPIEPQLYREGISARLSGALFLPLILGATAAAWEGAKQARLKPSLYSATRPPTQVLLSSLLPVFASVTVGFFGAMMLRMAIWGLDPPIPDTVLLLEGSALILGFTIAGWLIGFVIKSVAAAPIAAVFAYLACIFAAILQNRRMFVLTGDHSGCCGLDQEIDPVAHIAPVLVAMSMIGMGWWITSVLIRRISHRFLVIPVLSIASLLIALWLPSTMEFERGLVARSSGLNCEVSAASDIEYCVWEEQDSELGHLTEVGDATLAAWKPFLPSPLPKQVTGKARVALDNDRSISIAFPDDPSFADLVLALSAGILPEPANCTTGTPNSGLAWFYLMTWLMVTGGVAPDDPAVQQFDVALAQSSAPSAFAQRLEQHPLEVQQAWYEHAVDAVESCDTTLSLDLS